MFYAFSKRQFDEGMKKLLLDPEGDAERIRRTPAGGFILADKVDSWTELIEAFVKEIRSEAAADQTGEGFIYDMFYSELANHEYGYTGRIEDALDALPFYLDEIRADIALPHGLKKAMQSLMEEREKDK